MKNNKKIIIYILACIIIIITTVGTSFAYFSAYSKDDARIQGNTTVIGFDLLATKVSQTGNTTGLVPLDEINLQKALEGDPATGSKMCVDMNNNTVCQIYKISVENTGNDPIVLNGNLEITAETYTNLKWNLMTDASTVSSINSKNINETTIVSEEMFEKTDMNSNSGNDYKEYYIMIYINNQDSSQVNEDVGPFSGTITFNSAMGSKISTVFTS